MLHNISNYYTGGNMAPKVKFQKEQIIDAALKIVRAKGIDALTARETAAELGVSTRPIFTWYETMERLKADVRQAAKDIYLAYLEQGLKEPVPFLGIWHQYIRFAREEPELYKLLYLTKSEAGSGGATEALRYSQDLARPSVMRTYNIDAQTADKYFRSIWLAAFSFAALIVTGDCSFSDEEIFDIGSEISLSLCKAYKEVPGLADGTCDKDAVFRELVKKSAPKQEEK